ncbi:hypothetical protein SDC9_183663 [bioreactor metagenome]|uniref:RNA polymerase sigma factor 54 DNA-binding domain-containing protein n=1 Tax=bioreactor metagenome TaxID=1076179 RepID=A0A645HCA6_9ZZZZ
MNADSDRAISSQSIKNIIQEIVDKEDRNKPYSDQYICELLEKQGISISRRTVAKYRKQSGISSAALRKEEGSFVR